VAKPDCGRWPVLPAAMARAYTRRAHYSELHSVNKNQQDTNIYQTTTVQSSMTGCPYHSMGPSNNVSARELSEQLSADLTISRNKHTATANRPSNPAVLRGRVTAEVTELRA